MRTLTLSSCLLLSGVIAAQGGDQKPPRSNPPPDQSTKKTAGQDRGQVDTRIIPGGIGFLRAGLIDDTGRPLGPEAAARMRAAQRRLARGVPAVGDPATTLTGDHLFTPMVSVKPRRLAPGQVGDLYVVVTLSRGGHVVVPGGIAELRLTPDAGPFEFGDPKLDSAGEGRLAGKFKGRPVYEDMLLFEVPIKVRADAEKKQHPVTGVVRLALVDGQSGRPVGVFESKLIGTIVVGAPLPSAVPSKSRGTGEVVPGSETGPPPTPTTLTARTTPRRGVAAAADSESRVANNGELESPAVTVDSQVRSADESVEVPVTGFDLLWLAIGGGVVILMMILVLRRK